MIPERRDLRRRQSAFTDLSESRKRIDRVISEHRLILLENGYELSPAGDTHNGSLLHLIQELTQMSLRFERTHSDRFHGIKIHHINQFINQSMSERHSMGFSLQRLRIGIIIGT